MNIIVIFPLIGLLELVAFMVILIKDCIKMFKFARLNIGIKQSKLQSRGLKFTIAGTIIGIGLPRIVGVRYSNSDTAQILYVLITTLGFFVFIIGMQFILAAYETEEQNPKWVAWILKIWK